MDNEYLFLSSLAKNLDIAPSRDIFPSAFNDDQPQAKILDLRESLERFLFQKGVTENRTVVIIIDEAQKLTDKSLKLAGPA